MKLLSDKVCRNRLNKWLENKYDSVAEETFSFYNDIEGEEEYAYKYERTDFRQFILEINRYTGEIKEVEINVP